MNSIALAADRKLPATQVGGLAKIIPNVDIEGEQLMEKLEAEDAAATDESNEGDAGESEPEADRELVSV